MHGLDLAYLHLSPPPSTHPRSHPCSHTLALILALLPRLCPGSPIQIPMLSPSSRTRTPTRAQVTAPDGEKMNSVINVRSHDLTIPYP